MEQPNRQYAHNEAYRFGFNGKENDREWGTASLTQDYGFRLYNPAIAKFLSVDPLAPSYPWNSTYAFAEGSPIKFIDLDGLESKEKGTAEEQTPDNFFTLFFMNMSRAGHELHKMGLADDGDLNLDDDDFEHGLVRFSNAGFQAANLWTLSYMAKHISLKKSPKSSGSGTGVKPSSVSVVNTTQTLDDITYSIEKITVKAKRGFLGRAWGAVKRFFGVDPRNAMRKNISDLAEQKNIYSAQKTLNPKSGESKVETYFQQMESMTPEEFVQKNSAAAGFIDKTGKIVLTDGNHKMNAALRYLHETGDNKFVEVLINKGNFTRNIDLKQYGIKSYTLPTK